LDAKNGLGSHFGLFFNKLIRSPCHLEPIFWLSPIFHNLCNSNLSWPKTKSAAGDEAT
jgi:hypothetical protein